MNLNSLGSESVMMLDMVIDMEEARLRTIAQVKAFLDGTAEVAFRVPKAEQHWFIQHVRKRFGAARHGRGLAGRNECPFAILGFYANNGSEYIYQVAGLLETLWVEFTTSRPLYYNDTAWRSPRAAQS
jgi:hypothetical protein